ncbi:carboxypeptidase-like regulatory domain-containing protein [uncultured Pseudodesulfovibrio sp.]|uniref:carboxypeptidase-like regulatory domain-containing protein n=1 Tax=uncultured Pseudodesulfovibrio sp. TaxID=2035858 RepID=UPI0029C69C2A|nr:carboxypeptidase-like regulatory domain-containing protein [uncultured Pseudodesulfovibrio sp.]
MKQIQKRLGCLCLCLLVFLVANTESAAHGVAYDILDSSHGVGFEVRFSTGDPAAYAEVLVYSPEKNDVEFQNGRTDALGRFVFLPDTPGKWRVEADAGLGHKVRFNVDVDESGIASAQHTTMETVPKSLKAGLGVSLFLNVGLLGLYIRKRSALKKESTS